MGGNSIRADKLLAIVPKILNEKEAFNSGRFFFNSPLSVFFLALLTARWNRSV